MVISFHIPGKQNVLADGKSRKFNDQLEWKLDQGVFKNVCAIWQRPEIDVFASRLNYQIEKFCSWEPDPQSTFVNALTLKWSIFFILCICFSSFQYTELPHSEDQGGQSKSNTDCAILANSNLVSGTH